MLVGDGEGGAECVFSLPMRDGNTAAEVDSARERLFLVYL